jgi:hypothetical protein
MVENIPRIQSALNFFVHRNLNCHRRTQMFELCQDLQGLTNSFYLYITIDYVLYSDDAKTYAFSSLHLPLDQPAY